MRVCAPPLHKLIRTLTSKGLKFILIHYFIYLDITEIIRAKFFIRLYHPSKTEHFFELYKDKSYFLDFQSIILLAV